MDGTDAVVLQSVGAAAVGDAADTVQGAPHQRVSAAQERYRVAVAVADHFYAGGEPDGARFGIVAYRLFEAVTPCWRKREAKDGRVD